MPFHGCKHLAKQSPKQEILRPLLQFGKKCDHLGLALVLAVDRKQVKECVGVLV